MSMMPGGHPPRLIGAGFADTMAHTVFFDSPFFGFKTLTMEQAGIKQNFSRAAAAYDAWANHQKLAAARLAGHIPVPESGRGAAGRRFQLRLLSSRSSYQPRT